VQEALAGPNILGLAQQTLGHDGFTRNINEVASHSNTFRIALQEPRR